MLACVDVQYQDDNAAAACLTFSDWTSSASLQEFTAEISGVEPYVSGEFYRRELPCLLEVLARLPELPEVVVIDGYVWLGDHKPGLGAYLFEALAGRVPIVGVAKTSHLQASPSVEIFRGESRTPLLISAVGIGLEEAASLVSSMNGSFRIPTLLKKVDQLARAALRGSTR